MIFIKKYDIIYIESERKEMIRLMIITEFHVAYAYRKEATPEDIVNTVDNLREAERIAYEYLCDDDDSRVWINVDGQWYCVFGRDRLSDRLIVSEGMVNAKSAYVSEWY